MNPSRKPSWRVVTQRLASAIVALARPPPGGMTWSSRSVSSLPMSDANAPVLARTQPARSTTPDRSTTPGSGLPRAAERAGHDARHRLGVGRLGCPQLGRCQGPRGGAQPADGDPLDLRPVDEPAPGGLLGVPAGDGRGGAERGADQEAGLPDAVVAPRRPALAAPGSAGPAGPLVATAHRAGTASSTRSTSGNAEPNSRPASAWNAAGSPVVSWRCPASGCVGPVASLEPVDVEQLGQGRRGRRRRVDDRDVVARDPGDDRAQQRVVGAAEQQRVDRRSGRAREDRLAGRVALAEQRRERLGDRGLGGRARSGRPPRPAARASASRARRPRPRGSRP